MSELTFDNALQAGGMQTPLTLSKAQALRASPAFKMACVQSSQVCQRASRLANDLTCESVQKFALL